MNFKEGIPMRMHLGAQETNSQACNAVLVAHEI